MTSNTKKALIVFGLNTIVSIISVLWAIYINNQNDSLNRCIAFKNGYLGEPCMSWWPVTHFVLFLVIGLVFPADWLGWWFAGSVYWETLEYVYGRINVSTDRDTCTNCQYTKWLDASPMDLVANGLGLSLGWALRKYVFRY